MKIFVTGGNGFLGKHLVSRLKSNGHEVVSPSSSECNLTNAENLDKYSDHYDLIFHLAAYTQAGDWCLTHPGEQWLVNQLINTNVLSWWHRYHKNTKLIAIGTSCSYAPEEELIEGNYMVGEPIESLYTYAMTKRMLLQGLIALNKQYGLNYLYVIPSTLYGTSYHNDGRQMHFIFDLIRKILRGRDLNETVTLWGDGYQTREIVHVDDFISNLLELLKTEQNDIYNLGSGEEYSIRYFAEKISNIAEFDPQGIQYDTSRYVGARNKLLNVDKIRKKLETFENRNLESGLKEVINWFEETKSYL